ncbi:MAG: hypothetical protein LAO77_15590 [Acidobacteriia bacterium]|nr:hypothetical protein [Terriglobia bacterium]
MPITHRRFFVRLVFVVLLTAVTAAQGDNVVEPLSNGLSLSMSAEQVRARFGAPVSDFRSSGGGINYRDFSLVYNSAGTELWHCVIKGSGVRLASGITIGSDRSEVERVFGNGDHAIAGRYELSFQYTRGAVREIRINVASGPASRQPTPPTTPPTTTPRPTSPTTAGCRLEETEKKGGPFPMSSATENAALFRSGCVPAEIVGSWFSQGTSRIDILADGTYSSPSGGRGDVRVNGAHIIFTGPLAAWNNGRAFWAQRSIQFYWRNPSGSINAFAFIAAKR